MSLSYGFCLGGDDTEYTSKQFSDAMRQFTGDGVCDSGGKLALSISGFTANLATGYVLTAGRWVENSEPLLLVIPPSGNYEDRVDSIAAVADEKIRKASIEILDDVDPEFPPDGTLYLISVKRGSITLSNSNAKDFRTYIIPLSRLSKDAVYVYDFLKTGIDQSVDNIILLSKQEIYRAYMSYEQLKGTISAKGGHPGVGDLLTSCIKPAPENQWLLCSGGAVPEEYEELIDVVGENLPDIQNADQRFKTYIYAGQIGLIELPPVEPPIKPPVTPDMELGKDWLSITLPRASMWYTLGYGNGKFITGSSEGLLYSLDGINWLSASQDIFFRAMAYGGGVYVLTGSTSLIHYSSDGINWTHATEVPTDPEFNTPYDCHSIAYGNGRFVSPCSETDKVLYSNDGVNWEIATLPASASWDSIAYGNGRFVTLEYNGDKVASSSDGINWSLSHMPSSGEWYSIAYGEEKFVAICYSSPKFAYSEDGITWTESAFSLSAHWYSIAYGEGVFVVIAMGTNKAAYSKNGIDWIETTLPYVENWSDIAYGDGKFVVLSRLSDKAAYSISSSAET